MTPAAQRPIHVQAGGGLQHAEDLFAEDRFVVGGARLRSPRGSGRDVKESHGSAEDLGGEATEVSRALANRGLEGIRVPDLYTIDVPDQEDGSLQGGG